MPLWSETWAVHHSIRPIEVVLAYDVPGQRCEDVDQVDTTTRVLQALQSGHQFYNHSLHCWLQALNRLLRKECRKRCTLQSVLLVTRRRRSSRAFTEHFGSPRVLEGTADRASDIYFLVIVRIVNVELVWVDADNWSSNPKSVFKSELNPLQTLTVLLMHLFYFANVLTALDDIIVELVPQC